MSEANFPGMMPTQAPPPGAPGSQNVQSPAELEQLSLNLRMGEAFKSMGEELLKGPKADPVQLVRARGMLQQIFAQHPSQQQQAPPSGAPSGGPFGGPRTGVPQPVDGRVDAMTGRPIGNNR